MTEPAPAPAAPAAEPAKTPTLEAALMKGLFSQPEEAPPAAPPAPPQAAPPADPVQEIAADAPSPDEPSLPIDDLADPPADPEPSPDKKDKVAFAMKELREEVKKWKTETEAERQAKAQLESRLADLEAKAKLADEMKPKLEEYEQEMLAVRIEKSAEYQEHVAKPVARINAELADIAKRNSLDFEKLADIMDMEDKTAAKTALNDLVSGLDVPVSDMVDLLNLKAEYLPIKAKQQELYAKADRVLLELEARGQQKSEAEILAAAEARERAFPVITGKLARSLPYFKDIIETASAAAKDTDPGALDTNTATYNHIVGLALPKIARAFMALSKEKDELLDELAGLRKVTTLPGGFTSTPGGAPPKDLASALISGLGLG